MFKFIHTADIHLDSPQHKLDRYEGAPVDEFRQATRRAFENLVQLALSEKVAFVLIAGDLFDGDWKDYNTGLFFVAQMARLRDADIQVFIVAGNHDAANKITKTLRLPDNVKTFPTENPATFRMQEINVAVHGQSFASPVVKKNLSAGYPKADSGFFNIGLLHSCLTGREGHEPYAPCSPEGLRNKGYDYWALGHVHQSERVLEEPPIVFSGNLQGRHARETGPKGCMLVSVDDDSRAEVEFRPTDVVRWVTTDVAAAGSESGYDIVDLFGRRLLELLDENEGLPLAVRVHIEGETHACDEVLADLEHWSNEIRSSALEIGSGRVWVEKVKFRLTTPASVKRLKHAEGAIDELLKLFDELAAEPESRIRLATELSDLGKKLPRELKEGADAVRFDDPDWLMEMLDQARPMLIRRLLKKGTSE
ncbi:MAG: DNA repair exonuclease [Desulfobacterales bacterium]